MKSNINQYYDATKGIEAHNNIQEFLKLNIEPSNAIDLGCGAGRDTIELIKTLSNELLKLLRIEENDKTKNMEENLARTINYMSGVLYNQLRSEKSKIKESKLNEFSSYIQAEKILLDNIDELRENMYVYTYKIKRKLREIKE